MDKAGNECQFMKPTNLLLATIMAICITARSQGVILNTGDSYTYEFSSLPLQGTTTYVFLGGHTAFGLDAASLTPGYAMRFEAFENSDGETPLFSAIRTVDHQFVGADLAGHWLDHQGVVRFTMLSGTAKLVWLDFDVFMPLPTSGSEVYHLDFVPVPEPSVLAFCAIAAVLFILGQRAGPGLTASHGAVGNTRRPGQLSG